MKSHWLQDCQDLNVLYYENLIAFGLLVLSPQLQLPASAGSRANLLKLACAVTQPRCETFVGTKEAQYRLSPQQEISCITVLSSASEDLYFSKVGVALFE